ncbi:MAG: hypothetical protein IJT77_11290 [Clostridia bacterium]|nr:hypothetical protein [Clostridia bacterium]
MRIDIPSRYPILQFECPDRRIGTASTAHSGAYWPVDRICLLPHAQDVSQSVVFLTLETFFQDVLFPTLRASVWGVFLPHAQSVHPGAISSLLVVLYHLLHSDSCAGYQ